VEFDCALELDPYFHAAMVGKSVALAKLGRNAESAALRKKVSDEMHLHK